jgi:oligoribonuclease
MSKKANLLWMDLEMTGLDPVKDKIMEVAVIATDWRLNEVAKYEAVVKVGSRLVTRRMTGDFWEKNKAVKDTLVKQNLEKGRSGREIEDELIKFVKDNFKGEIYLAGNSIHQDRKFIDNEWKRLSKMLHYRMLDVSAWKVWFENARGKKFTKPESHRAMDDIGGSIEELKWYLTFLK